MTADNTSSEFALLTYAHHIVDTLANSTVQWIRYPSANNFIYYRIHPIFAPAGMGLIFAPSSYYHLQRGYLWSSSVPSGSSVFHQYTDRYYQNPQGAANRLVGFSLRCVAR